MHHRWITTAAATLLLISCTTPPTTDSATATVTVHLDLGTTTVQPSGVPTLPNGTPGITQAELLVFANDQQLAFDANGNITPPPGTPILITTGSVTLQLPQGTYDFTVIARDDDDNDLADGTITNIPITGDTTLPIELISFIANATLTAPQTVIPNQVVDIPLNVHPPGRPDLIVPTSDYTATYTATTDILSTSNRGLRLLITCEAITVTTNVADRRGNPPITQQVNLPISALCDSYGGGIDIDLIPPQLDLDLPPTTVTINTTTNLTGTTYDAQTGIASVTIHEGPIPLGNATLDTTPTPHTWTHPFTPTTARNHILTITATDNAGNQTFTTTTITAEDTITPGTFATRAGGTGNDVAQGISTLPDGSAIATGFFNGTATFGTTTLTSSGGNDVFVAKTNPDGSWSWAARAGGTLSDRGYGVSALSDGSAIITGDFNGAASFGDTILTSSGGSDIFVAKTNQDGTWAWATRAGGSIDIGRGVSTLTDGSAIITGTFAGTATFGGTTLTSNAADVFVAKTNPDGTWDWATKAGGINTDIAHGVSSLTDGSAITTGYFNGTATFGTTTLTSDGNHDVFVAKTNPDGTWAWATRAGGILSDIGYGVSTLPDGSAITTGLFTGTATFGTTTLTSDGGNWDAFVAKTNPDGTWAWATRSGGAVADVGYGVSTLADGSAIITGYFGGTATFGTTTLTSNGGISDVFVAKTNPDGTWGWATNAGGAGAEIGNGVSTLTDGSAIITGYFGGTATFGTTTLTSNGGQDVLIAKIGPGGAW